MKCNLDNRAVYRSQGGMTLVELMVAVTIGLILLAGVIQIFSSSKQLYRVQEATSRLQENGRYAMNVLTRDIRMADFWGCQSGKANMTNHLADTSLGDFGSGGLDGTDGGGTAPDTITLRSAYGSGISVVLPFMVTKSSDLKVTAGVDIKKGDILIVSDCNAGDIFQVTNISTAGSKSSVVHSDNSGVGSPSPGNDIKDLSKTYEGDASIYMAHEIIYSIKNDASGQPALFRSDNLVDQELVEGVENMQILYGEDTNADQTADRYVPAGTAGLNMDNVVSVRVTLTVRTVEDNVALTTASGDKRIRKDFTSTITIRNRAS